MVIEVAARDAEYIRDFEEYIMGYITTHKKLNNFHFIMLYQTCILHHPVFPETLMLTA